jgi:DNA polymerase-3 subunit delta
MKGIYIMKKIEKFKNPILTYGEEIYLQDKLVKKIKQNFLKDESMNFLKIDKLEENIDDLINFFNTVSFSTGRKLAVVEECTFLTTKGKLNDEVSEKLIGFFENELQDGILVFLGGSSKIDKRKKIYKYFKKNGELIEYKKLNEKELINWITRYLDYNDRNINYTEGRLIANYSGYLEYESQKNLYDVKNELDKLVAFTDEEDTIKKEYIEKIMSISIDNNIFKFIDNIFEGKTSKAYEMLEDMISNNISPHYIYYMIIRQIRMLNQLSAYKEKNFREDFILKKMKIRSFIYKRLNYQYNNLGKKKIEYLSFKSQVIERKAKTGNLDIVTGINILINKANK